MQNYTAVVAIANEIEVKDLAEDKKVAWCLAAIPNWRRKDGTKDFIDLVFWDQTAVTAAKHLSKGSKIVISGRLSSEFYERKDGKKALSTKVVVEEFEFASPPRQAQQEPYSANTRARKAA